MLSREFGRTYDDIMSLPSRFYEDAVLIISKQNAIQQHENKKAMQRLEDIGNLVFWKSLR